MSRGIDLKACGRDDAFMDTPNTPRQALPDADFDFRLQALLDLKQQMHDLHARLEYVRLMLKLGVRLV